MTGPVAANVEIDGAILAAPVVEAVALERLLTGAVDAALFDDALVAIFTSPTGPAETLAGHLAVAMLRVAARGAYGLRTVDAVPARATNTLAL